jgi:broad specificity phosphatase PhoE
MEHIESIRFPQGETLDDLRQRVFSVLDESIQPHLGQEIALVTHQVVIRVLFCAVLSAGNHLYWRLGQDPGCLNLVEQEEGIFRLQLLNYVPPL